MNAASKFEVMPTAKTDGQPLPSSEESELYLLACCLIDGNKSIADALAAGITAKAFYSTKNALLWDRVVGLFRERPPVTIEMLAEELRTRGEFEALGGAPYLLEILKATSTTINVQYFIGKLLEKSALRFAIRTGADLQESARNFAGGPLDDLFAKHLSALSNAVRHARRGATQVGLAERIDSVVADVSATVNGQVDKSGWIYTGLDTFDKRCRPLGCQAEDHLVVDAAGSGLGKSAFMRQIAGGALARGQRVRIYSRETSTSGCIEQLASSRTALDLMHQEEWTQDMLKKFAEECAALREIADKRFWCVQSDASTPLFTIEELEDDARYFAATQGAPHLWIVDYLQLFGAKRRFSAREQEVAYVSHRLQALCRELGGVWVVGCQMNEKGLSEMRQVRRDAEDKVIHRLPGPGDLRESQAIYHDADRVIAHYLPPVDSRDQDQTSLNIANPEVWLCQIKRRKGGIGVVKTWFEKRYTRFVELPSFTHAAATQPSRGMTKAQFKGERS